MTRCLVCLGLVLCVVSSSFAQDEEPIFSSDEALTTTTTTTGTLSPTYPATAYWKVAATMTLAAAAPGTHVQMLLPLSDGRQSVLARHTGAEGVNYREEADGLNLWGHWQVTGASGAKRQISYEYTVQIADARTEVPSVPFPPKRIVPGLRAYLLPSALIQSDVSMVRARAQRLVRGSKQVDQAVWVLYQHTAAFVAQDTGKEQSDALSVLTAERGSRFGKTRALVALLRAAGIPARLVGGIRLGDTARKRTTISWAEALIGETWVPIDPAGGHFAWLPNTYLALYRNDLPLLIHTRRVPVEYTFFIRQLTRTAVLATDHPEGHNQERRKKHALRYESEHVHTVAAYVDRPLASVVLLNDEAIPQGVADQMLAAAREAQINIALLSADFESSYFREHYLQSLVSTNLTLLREADLLLINTADTAGLYALLKQGELGVKLDGLQVVIAGGFAQPVGRVLGAVLLRVLEPTEVVLIQQQPDLARLWEIARIHLHDGLPLVESATRYDAQAAVLNAETLNSLGWWRRGLVKLWVLAVQTQVPLPSLNLILVLPLIAFFLLIIRNVIGLETFGTFSPMLLSLAFLTTGLGWGLVVFLLIVVLGSGLRLSLQRLRLHLVSRIAILIAVVAVSMAGLTVLGATLGIGALLHASIFPMVIMANQIESFTNTQLERGTGEALRLTLSTLLVATCSYVGIENTGLKPLVLTFPEILIGVIGIELLLGRWRGFRLVEYVRFYGVWRQDTVSFQPSAVGHTPINPKATTVAKSQTGR
ncbi:MAG TPA: 7TM domain-containing protein [Candidatus Binatia bacterium]|nr:7TM domain-containing protein [Candidatus Binatia bacterium]